MSLKRFYLNYIGINPNPFSWCFLTFEIYYYKKKKTSNKNLEEISEMPDL